MIIRLADRYEDLMEVVRESMTFTPEETMEWLHRIDYKIRVLSLFEMLVTNKKASNGEMSE